MAATLGLVVVLIVVIVLLLVVAKVTGLLEKPAGSDEGPAGAAWRVVPAGPLLTPTERLFAASLDAAIEELNLANPANLLRVTWKVRLGDLVTPEHGLEKSESTSLRNRVNQQHLDFVVVRARDAQPLVMIELDDKSHNTQAARQRDKKKTAALTSAGFPLLRVQVSSIYDIDALADAIGSRVT